MDLEPLSELAHCFVVAKSALDASPTVVVHDSLIKKWVENSKTETETVHEIIAPQHARYSFHLPIFERMLCLELFSSLGPVVCQGHVLRPISCIPHDYLLSV